LAQEENGVKGMCSLVPTPSEIVKIDGDKLIDKDGDEFPRAFFKELQGYEIVRVEDEDQ
jgi:hypothetical protein